MATLERPQTPADLRQQAAALEAQAKALRREARQRRAIADVIEKAQLRASRLSSRTDSDTIGSAVEATIGSSGANRRGPKLRSTGPMAVAARNAGISMRKLARALGEEYERVKTWDRRRMTTEPRIRALLSLPPYSVPVDAWKA